MIDGADLQSKDAMVELMEGSLDLQASMRWSVDGRVAIEVVDIWTAKAVERRWKMSSWR